MVLAIVGAVVAAMVLLELLRLIIGDLYEWMASHAKVKGEIQEIKRTTEKLVAANRENGRLRDQRTAVRFRQSTDLQRLEKECEQFEQRRVEVWHRLGEAPAKGLSLYVAEINNNALRNGVVSGINAICPLWRHVNRARIWARNDRDARTSLQQEFALADGFSIDNLRQAAQPTAAPAAGKATLGQTVPAPGPAFEAGLGMPSTPPTPSDGRFTAAPPAGADVSKAGARPVPGLTRPTSR
ncbi:MAG: hypothetical protein PW843_17715 [Azospirillaceae bacterium]|nr:hypothetical protein [Azospirillaceae bacterium]